MQNKFKGTAWYPVDEGVAKREQNCKGVSSPKLGFKPQERV